MFTIGYSIAMLVSLLAGVAWDVTGNAAFAFLPIALAVLPVLFCTPLIDFSKRRS
jgi:CP family cyanate transporter-like MFS transporter